MEEQKLPSSVSLEAVCSFTGLVGRRDGHVTSKLKDKVTFVQPFSFAQDGASLTA